MEGTSTSKGPVGKMAVQSLYDAATDTTDFPHEKADHPLQVPLHRSASMTFTNNITFDVATPWDPVLVGRGKSL